MRLRFVSSLCIGLTACACGLLLHSAGTRAAEGPPAPIEEADPDELDLDELRGDLARTGDTPGQIHYEPYKVRSVTLLLADVPRRGTFQFMVDHRAFQFIGTDSFHDFLGLDAGNLKIGLTLGYSITDFLDFRIIRQNNTIETYDTYEFLLRGQILDEESRYLDLTVGASASWFSQKDREDAVAWNGQVMAGRTILYGVSLHAGALGSSDSSGLTKSLADDDWSLAVAGELAWKLPFFQPLRLAVDAAFPVAGYDAGTPAWSAGATFFTYHHGFTFLVTNNQLLTTDALAAGSYRDADDVVFGFTITRQWDL